MIQDEQKRGDTPSEDFHEGPFFDPIIILIRESEGKEWTTGYRRISTKCIKNFYNINKSDPPVSEVINSVLLTLVFRENRKNILHFKTIY